MILSEAVERLELVVATAGSTSPAHTELAAAMRATSELRSFIDAQRAELVRTLGERPTSFPEATIAETSGCSLGEAAKEKERADTLGAAGAMAEALSDGAISSGHVDALNRAKRNLDEAAASSLLGDDQALADAASQRTIAEFDAWVKKKAKALDTSDADDRLAQQRRATRLKTWTDEDGMYNMRGRFDPDLGKDIARQLAAATRTKFADATPNTAPTDPFERRQHLEALALADLLLGDGSSKSSAGAPIVVVDASQTDGAGEPVIDWGIPVDLPRSVLFDVLGAHEPDVVIVSNGVVLYAPGNLDLGRNTRLASPQQRRALAGLYSTCAVPGCAVHYDRCRLHHILFWHDGGRTDLDNLLPVCQHHHTLIHNDSWTITLGRHRELTIRLPDGQILTNGPPTRNAA